MHNEKTTIFIDGSSGTAGLRIYDRLAQREDIDLLTLPPELHHDIKAQRELINRADIAFLCLPDAAAITAADLVENPDTVVLDTSTAHRTAPGWTYGFPELSPEREAAIRTAKRIAVPGCHASGFIVLVYPLVEADILPPDALLTCYSLTGYSGGGKKMIAEIESPDRAPELYSPRFYGLANNHKHLPEMQKISGLEKKPMFTPIVDDYYNGMVVCVPIQAAVSGFSLEPERVQEMLERHYEGSNFVHVQPLKTPAEMTATKLSCNDLRDTNQMEIFVFGDAEQILLCSRLDNLGKGASGAAVQCMNIMLGLDETVGLL